VSVPPTLIAVILDESGSMGVARDDVIGGFNRFVDDQRLLPDSCRLSLTKFNTLCGLLFPPTSLIDIPPLDEATYTPGGGTALFDAIAETVRVAQVHQHDDERVLCLIITDGHENSSRETTAQQVTDLIRALEARGDWTFVYLGVTPDEFVRDMDLTGTMTATNTAAYDPAAPRLGWETISTRTAAFRSRPDRSTADFYRPRTGV
jgi:Mg-chelatase subunit ChlD